MFGRSDFINPCKGFTETYFCCYHGSLIKVTIYKHIQIEEITGCTMFWMSNFVLACEITMTKKHIHNQHVK